MIIKDPLAQVSIGHKQHTEVKSKWHEQETSLAFKLGQIEFHRVMFTNKFNSIKPLFIACLLCARLRERAQTLAKTVTDSRVQSLRGENFIPIITLMMALR